MTAAKISKLQLAIAAAIDSYDLVGCADVAERAAEQLGYEPSLPSVSRVLNAWGWMKIDAGGKVAFRRPPAMPLQTWEEAR
jgi:hypothetical protein